MIYIYIRNPSFCAFLVAWSCVLLGAQVRLANSNSKGSGKGPPPGGSMGMALGGLEGCPPNETIIIKGIPTLPALRWGEWVY